MLNPIHRHPIAFTVSFTKIPAVSSNQRRRPTASEWPAGEVPGEGEFEFHVSRKARERYEFDLSLFTTTGNVIFANFYAAQLFAQKINQKRDLLYEAAVSAAEINALGLIDEILHSLIEVYRQQRNPKVFQEALENLETTLNPADVDAALRQFLTEFPPLAVYRQEIGIEEYLQGTTNGRNNREIAIEEMLMLWLANRNPAFNKYVDLFEDASLEEQTVYPRIMSYLADFFEEQPLLEVGGKGLSLFKILQSPAQYSPVSLVEQLHYLRDNFGTLLSTFLNVKWELLLGKSFVEMWGVPGLYDTRLLRSLDFLSEEQKMRFDPGLGPAPTQTLEFGGAEYEPEQFSPDLHWMPQLVLLAKSTLVWLDQLSKKYQRWISRLDQIPDEELDQLARWGFTGLWLIGVWERSPASKEIKRMCGNPEAESSAYSLYDYQVAGELGGDEAYQNLRDRCWQRGIRMASDMVPNHTGIVSKWVREHPDWFIQLPYPPFPGYTFNGRNLSDDPTIGIFLEDHYYDRSDAAVVFKRVDYQHGETRYIYHGNDGTSMPWNDTAQLDYTKPEVREAVIQTIIGVARKFPIIRFDAAMTLAKRHYHRLWFPEPGSGGDIPSRAAHGMTRAEFDQKIPVEFWREVVDRVAQEVPDTLLLAEAFWLMEGYFVRSLGMHRVYNSAFMNMLKREENQKYRSTIKNTIEFEPEVLKRYVNFMNNPDEETAINQFGDGDKYFGVSVMMITMPGLPMFGHGQVEGLREKYGMEYRRAYHEETPNQYLIERHEREVFPLMKKRYLFAEVENFLLYDLYLEDGSVNENVFAYSNRFGDERALVVFHNQYAETRGWIHTSAAYSQKVNEFSPEQEAQRRLIQKNLGEGLQLPNDDRHYCIFRDQISGLEYIHSCKTLWEQGLYIELPAYKYRVFLNFRIVADPDSGLYARLTRQLNGRGVPSVSEAIQELQLEPLHQALRQILKAETFQKLMEERRNGVSATASKALPKIEKRYRTFVKDANEFLDSRKEEAEDLVPAVLRDLEVYLSFDTTRLKKRFAAARSRKLTPAMALLDEPLAKEPFASAVLLGWIFVNRLGRLTGSEDLANRSRVLLDEWLVGKVLRDLFQQLNLADQAVEKAVGLIKLLTAQRGWYANSGQDSKTAHDRLKQLLKEQDVRHMLGVNRFEDTWWFNKEAFATVSGWLYLAAVWEIVSTDDTGKPSGASGKKTAKAAPAKPTTSAKIGKAVTALYQIVEKWRRAEEDSQYQLDKLLENLKELQTPQKSSPAKTRSGARSSKKSKN